MNRFYRILPNSKITRIFFGLVMLAIIGQTGLRSGLAQVAKEALTADKVRKAIKRGVDNLKKSQKADGTWSGVSGYEGGSTALIALALLNAGENPSSPQIQKSIKIIQAIPRSKTYEVSLRVMALSAADPTGKRYRSTIQGDIEWLLKGQTPEGGWNYGGNKGGADASNSQFALLALSEANKYNLAIPNEHWQRAKDYWLGLYDEKSGGFRYNVSHEPIGSMTCAGIASLIIIRENLFNLNALANGPNAICCGGAVDDIQPKLDKAFKWLADRFTVKGNPTGKNAQSRQRFYYLYALERAGRFSGRRFLGPHDWYRVGAANLVKTQRASGAWASGNRGRVSFGEAKEAITTAFSLLFLSKGKRPVVIGKYDHGVDDWDQHPRGIHYLTRSIEKDWSRIERDFNIKLNWQTVRAKGATTNDLFESPVLFMSGRDAIGLDAQQKETLKEYIENGGFLFAEACQGDGCGDNVPYDTAFRELMAELFPDSQLQPLAPDHLIWKAQYKFGPSRTWPLLGLQACCRTSVVYCPANLSCYWALNRPGVQQIPGANPRLLHKIEYCKQVGSNVVAYATGRQLNERLDTQVIDKRATSVLSDRALVLPKLSHNGGADDAPNAWGKILKELSVSAGLEVKTEKKMIPADLESLADHPFVFMHGRSKFAFTEEERTAIRKYLELGGFIFADSICASKEFAESFRFEMTQILGQKIGPIPEDDEIWTGKRNNEDIANNKYGAPIKNLQLRLKDKDGTFKKPLAIKAPRMEGIRFDGRLVVLFSPYDLSCALENKTVSDCEGYSRAHAMLIARKIVLYSLLSDSKSPQ